MKKNENKRSSGTRIRRFFKHYFGLLILALACAALMTLALFYAFS